ncbi:MAG: DUF433 domain-containing protein [Bryobacteraceae bacterium]
MIDWTSCELVERVPGKVAGKPVIKGTRIEPDTIVQDSEMGSPVEEIHENFPSLTIDTIRKVIGFAHSHQPVL